VHKVCLQISLCASYWIFFKGNLLTENDIRIAALVLAGHLPELEESGLNLNQGERITKEEVVIHLRNIDQHELAKILSREKGMILYMLKFSPGENFHNRLSFLSH
jgi:hypothetical protein